MNLTHRPRGPQSRTWRDIHPQPAPCLPVHRCSCPMTAGHSRPDHDGGRRYRQRRRLEPLKDHNCGMARVAHHAAFRWQPDGARRCALCSRSAARWQKSPLPATAWSVKPAQFRLNSLKLAVLPSSGSFLMPGESDETPFYVYGSRSGAISGAPRSPAHGTLHPAATLRTVGAELRKRTVLAGNRQADVQSGHLLVTTIRREVRQTMNWITTLADPCDIGTTGRREWGVRMRESCHRPPGRQGRP
jgi:hypothetical protein